MIQLVVSKGSAVLTACWAPPEDTGIIVPCASPRPRRWLLCYPPVADEELEFWEVKKISKVHRAGRPQSWHLRYSLSPNFHWSPGLALKNSPFYFLPYVFSYLICIWLNLINTKHRYFLLWTSKVASFLSPLNINCIYDLNHNLWFCSVFDRSWVQSLVAHTHKNSVPSLIKGWIKLPHHYFSDTNVLAQRELWSVMICCSHRLKYIIIYLSIVQ